MAYQSLYRRYRPSRFAEVRGQADVVRALRNVVRDGRVGHAYLFSGPRGTGKTSTARILAKALNCTDLREGEPCCACESCLAIEAGTSYDLQELDAASNNGVDAMRELTARAAMGSPGRTKVYILDEVHMLSGAASAALLKTLEEPPAHVVFVLATTDPQKVLPTIRSRTQHFEFHLLPADELGEHVQWVIADAGLDADAEAVEYVLRVGGGSARDTLSALDQVVATGGVPDRGDQVDDLVDALADADTGAALGAVADSVRRGRDPRVLGEALLAHLRDVFLSRMGAPLGHLSDAEQERITAWSRRFTDRAVTRVLELLGEALRDMRQAPDPRIPLEVALVRATRADSDTSLDALVARIEHLEEALANGSVPVAPGAPSPAVPSPGASVAAAGAGATAAPPASDPPPPRPGKAGPAAAARAAAEAARRTSPPAPPSKTPDPAGAATGGPVPPSVPGRRGAEAPPASSTPADTATAPAASQPAGDDRPPAESTGAQPPADAAGRSPAPGVAPGAALADSAAVPTDAAPVGNGLPDRDALTLAWADQVLPNLKGLTKAMFSVGRFLETTDAAVLAMPGAVHRDRCEERRGEVDAALARHFGFPVPLRLVVDGEPNAPGRAADSPAERADRAAGDATASSAATDPIEAERVEVGDLRDLADAPADNRSTIDRLTEAFPGADVVEEP